MPSATTIRSFAKINLGLRIGPPRLDGFHQLTTLYQTIALHDEVHVEAQPAAQTRVTLTSNDLRLPTDERNTAYRMVCAALDALTMTAQVHVHLTKNLPVQGGLGAGSANAAAALIGLLRQLDPTRTMSGQQQLALAERIGSDVPLFLIGGAVYGHDRGQLVQPFPDLPSIPCVIAAPGVGSSTPQAFHAWDQRVARLTPAEAQRRLDELSRTYASVAIAAGQSDDGDSGTSDQPEPAGNGTAGTLLSMLAQAGMENDFEDIVFDQHPFLREIKRALSGQGSVPEAQQALVAGLSGSGSSLFGLYRTQADAVAAQQRAQAVRGRAFLTETLPRADYWRRLFA